MARTDEEEAEALERIREALRGLRFGAVTAIVHDGVVVQVERTEVAVGRAIRLCAARQAGADGEDQKSHGANHLQYSYPTSRYTLMQQAAWQGSTLDA